MPRPRTLPDDRILDAALALIHAEGPDAVTFAAVAKASGLAASTLVQRFGSKAALVRGAMLRAWDKLDEQTETLASAAPRTPEGAVALLTGLSANYGDIEAYAEALLVLREDLRDPALRARGARWGAALSAIIGECLGAPADPDRSALGRLMITQWQGALLWWAFDPAGRVEDAVDRQLRAFVAALVRAV